MLRILLIDSVLAFRDALAQNLLQYLPEGAALEAHGSTLNLRDKLQKAQPDVVILDTTVPESAEPKAWLARLFSQITVPVIFYNARLALRSVALGAGAAEFVLKPPADHLNAAFYQKVARLVSRVVQKESGTPANSNPMYIPPKGGTAHHSDTAKQEASSVGATLRSMRLHSQSEDEQVEEQPRIIHGVIGRTGANRNSASADMKRLIGKMKDFTNRLNSNADNAVLGGLNSADKFHVALPAVQVEEFAGPVAMIAVGASTGGTEALAKVLSGLRPPLPGIVVVQHIPANFSQMFAERLDRECAVHVKEAATGDKVERNNIYVAPGGKHMRVHKVGNDYMLDCQPGPKLHGVCPSADILFDSVADAVGGAALGVILTGMGRDGAAGMLHMRRQGSRTLGQDEASCVVYGMPRAAWECGAVARQVSLSQMAGAIMDELPGR